MSYETYEYSPQSGQPALRFLFVTGAVEYRFTTEPVIVGDSDGTWIPSPISCGEFSQTNEVAKDPLIITFPRTSEFAQTFIGGIPEQITTVTVFRLHTNDQDEGFELYWKGRVVAINQPGDAIELECENVFSSMLRPGIRARYQKTCRHALYGLGCTLDAEMFAVSGTATAVSGHEVTVPESHTSNGDGYFAGGMLKTTEGYLRYITSHFGNKVFLMTPIRSLAEEVDNNGSAAVTLYPGCDHTIDTCKNKFNNIENYGGFPWIPNRNPFNSSVTGSIA